jgi:predicted dehydrogenase
MGISVGMVGLGAFGSEFVAYFNAHPLVDRLALCDLEPERIKKFAVMPSLAAKFKPSDAYASLDDLLKTDIDAVVLITQPWLHAPQAIEAMEAGKHAYTAVPVISIPDADETIAWCDKLVGTCKSTGMHYMLGETTYYRPETMYCRKQAARGAFGRFVYGEGDYLHDVDLPSCNLRDVVTWRMSSKAGKEYAAKLDGYLKRGIKGGPMHYPTHSVSGPFSAMNAHALKVSCAGTAVPEGDDWFKYEAFGNETALFHMSNGASVRICEFRDIGVLGREMFSIMGTKGAFYGGENQCEANYWCDKTSLTKVTIDQMRDPLPEEVYKAFLGAGKGDPYGGHGGSHTYLVNEFVTSVAEGRQASTNAWEAVRWMAAGAVAHKSALKGGELLPVPDWGDAPK